MFIDPLIAKNPYTNIPFTKTELFNIYLELRLKGFRIPEFFQKFYECEFNIYEFRLKHDTELRDHGIKQYVKQSTATELYEDVLDMIKEQNLQKRIRIDSGFPINHFVKTMLPYLNMFFLGKYSFSSITRKYANIQLRLHLDKFASTNPIYGKRIIS
jgi:hypothetical protein